MIHSELHSFSELIIKKKPHWREGITYWVHPGRHLVIIPALKTHHPRICHNKTDDPSVMEKTSLKVHLEVKKTSPRIFPPRVNEYAKTLEKARLNMVETGWIRTWQITVGGYEIPKEQMCGCCVQLHQGFDAENFLGCKVKMWVYLKVLYMTSYFLILSLFCWATLTSQKQQTRGAQI